jgi:hypothetical protein
VYPTPVAAFGSEPGVAEIVPQMVTVLYVRLAVLPVLSVAVTGEGERAASR